MAKNKKNQPLLYRRQRFFVNANGGILQESPVKISWLIFFNCDRIDDYILNRLIILIYFHLINGIGHFQSFKNLAEYGMPALGIKGVVSTIQHGISAILLIDILIGIPDNIRIQKRVTVIELDLRPLAGINLFELFIIAR